MQRSPLQLEAGKGVWNSLNILIHKPFWWHFYCIVLYCVVFLRTATHIMGKFSTEHWEIPERRFRKFLKLVLFYRL